MSHHLGRVMGGACAILAGAFLCFAATVASAETVMVGRIAAEHRGSGGIYVTYDGVPVLRGGLLQLFAPTPGDSYSAGSAEPVVTVESGTGDERTIVARYRDTRGNFAAEERFRISPDATITVSLRCTWKGSEPAYIEWAPGMLWAYPLTGAHWTADGPDGFGINGVIAERAPEGGSPAATVASRFRALSVISGAFNLSIEAGPDTSDLVVLDGRRNPNDWARSDRRFWLGLTHGDIGVAAPLTRSLVLRLQPGSLQVPATDRMQLATRAVRFGSNHPVPESDPILIPAPKEARLTPDRYRVSARMPVTVCVDDERVGSTVDDLLRDAGVAKPVRKDTWTGTGLLVAVAPVNGASSVLVDRLHKAGLMPPEHEQGYRLRVDRRGIVIVGADPAGAFFGIQTLRQLARPSDPAAFRGADIKDWPSLQFRGAHLFVGNRALLFHQKLIDRVFSALKLNALVLECEYTKWDTDPAIAANFAMSKADLSADVAYARKRFLEPIPLVNCLGHAEWLFGNGRNVELAEDPDHPYAVRVTEEGTYRKLFGILGEVLDIFRPRYLHIGHDEMTNFGRYPYRAETKALGATADEVVGRAFTMSVQKLSKWLEARGVTPMLWGDMLLHRSEAQDGAANAPSVAEAAVRRESLLPDTVVADWHYDSLASEQYVSPKVFQQGGHRVLATTWYTPENIRGFDLAAIRDGAMGALQSTWAGYDSNEDVLPSAYEQFAAFVLAADYSWSGRQEPVGKLPYSATDVFKRVWRQQNGADRWSAAWYVDLSRAAISPVAELSGMPVGDTSVDSVPVHIEARGGRPCGVMLWGRLASRQGNALARSVLLTIGRKAKQLVFVHGCLVPPSGEAVGAYVVHYSDGSTTEIPLKYGDHVRAFSDAAATWSADVGWAGLGPNEEAVATRVLRWLNPKPSTAIQSIDFVSRDTVASPVLLAVTGLE